MIVHSLIAAFVALCFALCVVRQFVNDGCYFACQWLLFFSLSSSSFRARDISLSLPFNFSPSFLIYLRFLLVYSLLSGTCTILTLYLLVKHLLSLHLNKFTWICDNHWTSDQFIVVEWSYLDDCYYELCFGACYVGWSYRIG